jgi:hypothetical protein
MSATLSMNFVRTVVATAMVALAVPATAAEPVSEDCFDALVSARIVRQIPTVMPNCGNGCIVMIWPWFLDLRVRRVLEGEAQRGNLTVLSMQHTDYRRDLGVRSWWLRRNSQGGFNLLRRSPDDRPPRCAPGSPPAVAYIHPGGPRTLADYRREAEAALRD